MNPEAGTSAHRRNFLPSALIISLLVLFAVSYISSAAPATPGHLTPLRMVIAAVMLGWAVAFLFLTAFQVRRILAAPGRRRRWLAATALVMIALAVAFTVVEGIPDQIRCIGIMTQDAPTSSTMRNIGSLALVWLFPLISACYLLVWQATKRRWSLGWVFLIIQLVVAAPCLAATRSMTYIPDSLLYCGPLLVPILVCAFDWMLPGTSRESPFTLLALLGSVGDVMVLVNRDANAALVQGRLDHIYTSPLLIFSVWTAIFLGLAVWRLATGLRSRITPISLLCKSLTIILALAVIYALPLTFSLALTGYGEMFATEVVGNVFAAVLAVGITAMACNLLLWQGEKDKMLLGWTLFVLEFVVIFLAVTLSFVTWSYPPGLLGAVGTCSLLIVPTAAYTLDRGDRRGATPVAVPAQQ